SSLDPDGNNTLDDSGSSSGTTTGTTLDTVGTEGTPCTLDGDCPMGQICLPASGVCGPDGSCLMDGD
ncbi:MAG: hypothetical protein KC457_12545, partial [Myxococcales bacterium]|nr:hypothetical protein [Myxococcales bacterium]